MSPARRHLLAFALLLLLGAIVYAGSLSGDFLNWDDTGYVTLNPELKAPFPEAVGRILTTNHFANYNPLQRLSYLVEWKLFGDDATPYRVTNLLLHVLAAFLAYLLIAEWLGNAGAALAAAALFLVHPANVENAAWISERKTLLVAPLAFGSALLYLRGRIGASFALFTIGLFAKTSIVVLPVLLPLLDLARRRRIDPARVVLFLIPACVMGIVQVRAAGAVDAVGGLHGGSLLAHAATVVAVLSRYVAGLVVPIGVAGYHPYDPVGSPLDLRLLAGLALILLGGYAAFRSWRGERRVATALAWFALFLLVTIVVPIPILYAERYLYLAMPLLLGLAAERALRGPATARIGLIVLIGVLATGSALYALTWRTSVSHWERVVAVHPDDPKALTWLGTSLLTAGRADRAADVLRAASERRPYDAQRKTDWAVAEIAAGRPELGARLLTEVTNDAPETGSAWAHLARLRDREGDEKEAARLFSEGLRHAPTERILWGLLAEYHRAHGRENQARAAEDRLRLLGPGIR